MDHKHDTPTPPCSNHPDAWLDPTRQTLTRQHCRRCPNLVQCGQTALRQRPSYGMWAGIWIDGDFNGKKHLLGAVQPLTSPPTAMHPRTRRRRVGTLLIAPPPQPIAAPITARASGNCEIMAPACTYHQAVIFSRRRGATSKPLGSPADGIAACRNCLELIEHTDLPTALDLGYLVDPRQATSTAAMLWRQHRWVYLDTRGHLQPLDTPAASHTAC